MQEEAKKNGVNDICFAYNEYCFGIDIGDVKSKGANHKEGRYLIHDLDFEDFDFKD